jgi:hypothetical protein
MLHHKVVDFLSILVPPFLLVVCMVEVPLPFRHLNKVVWVLRVKWEVNSWCLEFSNGQRSERAVVLQAVCDMFRDGFNIEIEGGCCLGSPMLSKIICSSPCVGAAIDGFFGVKEWRGNCGPPLTFGFFSALAGLGVAMRSLMDV